MHPSPLVYRTHSPLMWKNLRRCKSFSTSSYSGPVVITCASRPFLYSRFSSKKRERETHVIRRRRNSCKVEEEFRISILVVVKSVRIKRAWENEALDQVYCLAVALELSRRGHLGPGRNRGSPSLRLISLYVRVLDVLRHVWVGNLG